VKWRLFPFPPFEIVTAPRRQQIVPPSFPLLMSPILSFEEGRDLIRKTLFPPPPLLRKICVADSISGLFFPYVNRRKPEASHSELKSFSFPPLFSFLNCHVGSLPPPPIGCIGQIYISFPPREIVPLFFRKRMIQHDKSPSPLPPLGKRNAFAPLPLLREVLREDQNPLPLSPCRSVEKQFLPFFWNERLFFALSRPLFSFSPFLSSAPSFFFPSCLKDDLAFSFPPPGQRCSLDLLPRFRRRTWARRAESPALLLPGQGRT